MLKTRGYAKAQRWNLRKEKQGRGCVMSVIRTLVAEAILGLDTCPHPLSVWAGTGQAGLGLAGGGGKNPCLGPPGEAGQRELILATGVCILLLPPRRLRAFTQDN